MSTKEIIDNKNQYEIPMSLYDINNTLDKNFILNNMVDIIKKNGNIFLLGYPTNNITMLMLKIYHENIVRIMNNKDLVKTSLMFMTGMLELEGEEGTIYATISESKREGLDYNKKLETFYSILINSGCNVEFIDGTSELKLDTSYKQGTTDFTENMYDTIKDLVFLDKDNKLNYSSIIKNYSINVKLMDSTNYIKKREEGFSFMPFKKINLDNSIHCIYGSLCVEAKLFGYIYSLGKKWKDVKGYIAYWVGKNIPPDHILKKYNYIKNTIDDSKLEKITNITLELLDKETLEKLNETCKNTFDPSTTNISFYNYSKCRNIFIYSIQPISLTCPGCYLNWQSYINNIQIKWDSNVCTPVNVSGGYRTNKKQKTKKVKRRSKRNPIFTNKNKNKIKNKIKK